MKDIVIVGAGGFGREVAWLIEDINNKKKDWKILGYIDENTEMYGKFLNGYKVLGDFEYFKEPKDIYYTVAVGCSKARKSLVEKCEAIGLIPATLIHPSTIMSKTCIIDKGAIICAENIFTVNITIGKYSLINLNCTLGHDIVLKDFVTLFPGVNISGNCSVGEGAEIGTGTKIIQGKQIGDYSTIGAGSVVIKDIEPNCIAVGVPTRVIKMKD